MKLASLKVSNRGILLALVSLLNISGALPVPNGISGKEADIRHDTLVRKVYGPWSEVRKLNGDYADYNEYWTGVQDFEPGPEDVPADEGETAESGPADFQSNYGQAQSDESEADVPFQFPSADPENHDLEGNVQWTSSAV